MSGIALHHAAFDHGVMHFVRTEKRLKLRLKRHTARGTEVCSWFSPLNSRQLWEKSIRI